SLALPEEKSPAMMADWRKFFQHARASLPPHYFSLGHVYAVRLIPEVTFYYMERLKKAFPDVSREELNTVIQPEEWHSRIYVPPQDAYGEVYQQMRAELPDRYFYPVSIEGFYNVQIIGLAYGSSPDELARMN